MASTRKARVPIEEQIRLINECRQSGMTDADWCRENDIAASTAYVRTHRRKSYWQSSGCCEYFHQGSIPGPLWFPSFLAGSP